jgi:hypothetical protein
MTPAFLVMVMVGSCYRCAASAVLRATVASAARPACPPWCRVLSEWQINAASFTAIPRYSDGSCGPEMDLRPFFAQFQADTT